MTLKKSNILPVPNHLTGVLQWCNCFKLWVCFFSLVFICQDKEYAQLTDVDALKCLGTLHILIRAVTGQRNSPDLCVATKSIKIYGL